MTARVLHGPKLNFSIPEKSLGAFFFKRCDDYADRICQVDGQIKKSETYASVKIRSIRVALALRNKGVTSEDVIVFCSSNTLDNTIPIIATAFLGAKIANLESTLSGRQNAHLIKLVEPKIIFVEENAVSLIEESLSNINFKSEIIVFGNSQQYPVFNDLLKPQEYEDEFNPLQVDEDNIAILFFSSGSTGVPKAICHSHKTFLKIIEILHPLKFGLVPFHFTTFYWITAMCMMCSSFAYGSYRVFCQNPSAEDFYQIVQTYKVQSVFAAPVLTYKLTSFKDKNNYNTSSIKMFIIGGATMATSQLLAMRKHFPESFVSICYGMTEIGFNTVYLTDTDKKLALSRPTTCGKVASETKIKVVDLETGKILGPHQQGEICIWSASQMVGYYKLDAAAVYDKDGFLKTGDIGHYDDEEFFYLSGRIKEMFKYQSWHIVPAVIESVLLEHPAVKEAIVFGLPDEVDGEIPAACLVLNERYTLKEKEIDELLKQKLSDRERLRGGITIVKNFPKTPTGKILRYEVKNFAVNMKTNGVK